MRMLIVEDDELLREQLVSLFVAEKWAVEQAADGEEALFLGSEHPYDAAIVDLGLPGLAGIELIRRWREMNREFPILILTARGDWQDKVEGLEAGADDYVTKPFYPEEVSARIQALLRRAGGRSQAEVSYGPVSINFSARRSPSGEKRAPQLATLRSMYSPRSDRDSMRSWVVPESRSRSTSPSCLPLALDA